MKNGGKLLTVIGAAAMLGGCQSFPLTSWMFKDKRPATQQASLAGNTAGALEEGRAHLRDGNIAAAVASFRIALLDPSSRADASNGLAVAYATLGRPDIAERYFRAAIAAEPDNPKFVANLLRLQQQVMLADRRAASEAVTFADSTGKDEMKAPARAATTGAVERISRNEVLVRSTSAASPRPAMAVVYRDALEAVPTEEASQVAVAASQASRRATVVFGE
jgi:Flp pilus assembly protein TadD